MSGSIVEITAATAAMRAPAAFGSPFHGKSALPSSGSRPSHRNSVFQVMIVTVSACAVPTKVQIPSAAMSSRIRSLMGRCLSGKNTGSRGGQLVSSRSEVATSARPKRCPRELL